MADSPRQLHLLFKRSLHSETVGIRDANGTSVCIICFNDEDQMRRSVRKRLTKENASAVGKAVARALTTMVEG